MKRNIFFYLAFLLCSISLPIIAATKPEKPIRFIQTQEKIVALTFDDGPSVPYTEQILDILNKHDVKATFYLLGVNIKTHPYIVKRMIQERHELGNHSMSHEYLKKKSIQQIENDIGQVDQLIRKQGYEGAITFRSPFGQVSDNIQQAVHNLNKKNVLFSYLSEDWEGPPAKVIHERIMKRIRPGFIITLHDGGKRRRSTVEATEMLIVTLKEQGYRFVTVGELLKSGSPQHVFH